tara:strand:- start:3513 stop:4205 length:693 start_codon:yes stop_codon:yes gene_type:complete
MYNGKSIIAIVPARGGSKGIPLKNLVKFKDKSLIQRVSEVIREIKEIDNAIVSTDNKDIAKEAKKFDLEVPFFRPDHLSGDFIGDVDVLTHALLKAEEFYGKKYDLILMLQPTSPSRTAQHIYQVLNEMSNGNYDSIWTISRTDKKFHPLKQLVISEGFITFYDDKGSGIIARQQLSDLYHRNGIAYLVKRKVLIEKKSILGDKPGLVLLDGHIVNIDTPEDIILGEALS